MKIKKLLSGFLSLLLIMSIASSSVSAHTEEGEYQRMTGLVPAIKALIHKDEIMATKYIGEVSAETWSAEDEYSVDDTTVLTKESGEDFVILNITDIHFADYDERAWMAFSAIATVKRLVRRVKPDLITVTGDIVCSESSVYSIKRFTDMMNGFGIPWAPVFGNHESDGNCDINYLADIMLKSKYCLLKKGDPALGVGNYVVNIAEKDTDGKLDIVQSLIMMDTHKTHLNEAQIQWYKWATNGINEACGKAVESTVFYHIPNVEYQYAYDLAWNTETEKWNDGFDASGELNEKICCHRDEDGNPLNNGFFDAVKSVGTTKNIFCGHEHLNNFSILYEGVRLTYTLKVGRASGFQFGFNGGTVITLNDSGISFKHRYSL